MGQESVGAGLAISSLTIEVTCEPARTKVKNNLVISPLSPRLRVPASPFPPCPPHPYFTLGVSNTQHSSSTCGKYLFRSQI
jgi:hypothetical protein